MSAYVPSPWFRFFPAEWLAATRGLKPAETGILALLLALMHERGEPLPEDHERLARRCSTTKASFVKALGTLLTEGHIVRKDDGLWSETIGGEIAYRNEKSQKLKQNSSKRWEKTKENQSVSDANGYRGQSSEVEGSPTANPSRGSSTTTGRSARYRFGETITLNRFGLCYVDRVGKDYITARSSDHGYSVRIDLGAEGYPIKATAVRVDDDEDELARGVSG